MSALRGCAFYYRRRDNDMLTANCYLKLEPVLNHRGEVRGFKVAGLTQGRPTTAETPGGRLVKLTVRMPDDAFNAIEAMMDVPAEYLEAPVTMEPEPTAT